MDGSACAFSSRGKLTVIPPGAGGENSARNTKSPPGVPNPGRLGPLNDYTAQSLRERAVFPPRGLLPAKRSRFTQCTATKGLAPPRPPAFAPARLLVLPAHKGRRPGLHLRFCERGPATSKKRDARPVPGIGEIPGYRRPVGIPRACDVPRAVASAAAPGKSVRPNMPPAPGRDDA